MSRKRLGFSLIELLIALAILAAVTTIAIRATSGLQKQAQYQATTRSLNDIQAAIVGPTNQRNSDGSALVTGFVADTGRLPLSFFSASDTANPADPLTELISNPNGITAFQPYSSNVDPSVRVWVGWQGPYMRLSAGPTFIRDGFGNSLHAYDAFGNLITTAGAPIAQLASWGADAQPDVNHQGSIGITGNYNDDVSVPNPTIPNTTTANTTAGFASYATIAGQVTMNFGVDSSATTQPSTSGGPPNPTFTGTPATFGATPVIASVPVSIWIDYVGPDLAQTPNPVGDIPVLVAVGSTTALPPVWRNFYAGAASSSGGAYSGQYLITTTSTFTTNVTIGPRVIKVYVLPATVINSIGTGLTAFPFYVKNANVTNPIYATSTLNVTLVGGAQTINVVLPHYSP